MFAMLFNSRRFLVLHRPLHSVMSERTIWSIIVALAAGIYVGASRESSLRGLPKDLFYVEKVSWRNCADVVIGGDSRAQAGVSPVEVERVLSGPRVRNFGFGGLGYSEQYLAAVEDVLAPDAARKTILLGICPSNFTTGYVHQNGFTEYSGRSTNEKWIIRHFSRLLDFCQPVRLGEFLRIVSGTRRPRREIQTFEKHGWFATEGAKTDFTAELKKHENFYKGTANGPAQTQYIELLLEKVKTWRARKIEVYGFRPPVCEEIWETENRDSGMDWDDFVKKFVNAGGVWLNVDRRAYATFDGSHLTRESAIELSFDLATAIRTRVQSPSEIVWRVKGGGRHQFEVVRH